MFKPDRREREGGPPDCKDLTNRVVAFAAPGLPPAEADKPIGLVLRGGRVSREWGH